MWSLFHTVTFFEKALKRSGFRKGNINLQNFQNSPVPNSTAMHPMGSHISWMLPPLLKVYVVISLLGEILTDTFGSKNYCLKLVLYKQHTSDALSF